MAHSSLYPLQRLVSASVSPTMKCFRRRLDHFLWFLPWFFFCVVVVVFKLFQRLTFFLKKQNQGWFPPPKGVRARKVQVQTKVKMMLSVSVSRAEGCAALEELMGAGA